MISTFTALLTAHLLADFILQTKWLLVRKREFRFLAVHAIIVGTTAAVTVGAASWNACLMIVIIAISHMAFDFVKIHYFGDTLAAFAIDQLAHGAVIVAIAILNPNLASNGYWACLPGNVQALVYSGMTLVAGTIATVPLGGILIRKLFETLPPAPAPGMVGMPNAGTYIGWLERGLTLVFIIAGRFEAVGFLLTAKSILRFGDIKKNADRHVQEYIIIGTMLSFGWGIGMAFLTTQALAYWTAD